MGGGDAGYEKAEGMLPKPYRGSHKGLDKRWGTIWWYLSLKKNWFSLCIFWLPSISTQTFLVTPENLGRGGWSWGQKALEPAPIRTLGRHVKDDARRLALQRRQAEGTGSKWHGRGGPPSRAKLAQKNLRRGGGLTPVRDHFNLRGCHAHPTQGKGNHSPVY